MVQLPPVALLSLLSTLGTLREQHLHSQKAVAAAGRCCQGSRAAGEKLGSLGPGGEPQSPGPAALPLLHLGISPACAGTFPHRLTTRQRKSQTLKNNKGFLLVINSQALAAAWTCQ